MDDQDKGNFDPLNNQPSPPPAGPLLPTTPDQPEDDYAAASRHAGDFSQTPSPSPQQQPVTGNHDGGRRNLIISAIALIALAVIAAAFYWFTLRNNSTPTPAPTKSSQTQTTQKPAASQINPTTKNYASPNFNLTFAYPEDWTVTDNGGGIMTVKSPSLQLKNAAGQTTNGQIVLTFRDHSQKLTEFDNGNATGVRDSVKIAYTKPTQTQRANTYISFLQYATTTSAGALDGIYITADYGYQKGQAIPLVDVSKVDPDISITFANSAGKPMSVTGTMWDDTNFSTPLTNIFKSLAIT